MFQITKLPFLSHKKNSFSVFKFTGTQPAPDGGWYYGISKFEIFGDLFGKQKMIQYFNK